MLVLDGCVLLVVWVPKGIDNEMGDTTLFEREACVFDDHQIFEQAVDGIGRREVVGKILQGIRPWIGIGDVECRTLTVCFAKREVTFTKAYPMNV